MERIWSAAFPNDQVRSLLSSEGLRWFFGHFSEILAPFHRIRTAETLVQRQTFVNDVQHSRANSCLLGGIVRDVFPVPRGFIGIIQSHEQVKRQQKGIVGRLGRRLNQPVGKLSCNYDSSKEVERYKASADSVIATYDKWMIPASGCDMIANVRLLSISLFMLGFESL